MRSFGCFVAASADYARVSAAGATYGLYTQFDDHIGRWHKAHRFYEPHLLAAIRDLRLDGHYIDIGAHVGNHAVYFRMCTQADRVTAFEPNPSTYQLLVQNARAYEFTAYNGAIHNEWTAVEVKDTTPGNTGMAHVVCGDQIVAKPLDAFDFIDVSLIKIDVEGLECAVLRSAVETIKANRPVLVTEAATPEAKAAIAEIVTPLGYSEAGCYCDTPTYIWTP